MILYYTRTRMRALLQRVRNAEVRVAGELKGRIGPGLLVFSAFRESDGEAELDWMARKIVQLRVFADGEGRMNLPLADSGGGILLVSQFTLYGDSRKGNRPSYDVSAPAAVARPLYDRFLAALKSVFAGPVESGVFGADMQVALVNDGPVTLWLEKEKSDA